MIAFEEIIKIYYYYYYYIIYYSKYTKIVKPDRQLVQQAPADISSLSVWWN